MDNWLAAAVAGTGWMAYMDWRGATGPDRDRERFMRMAGWLLIASGLVVALRGELRNETGLPVPMFFVAFVVVWGVMVGFIGAVAAWMVFERVQEERDAILASAKRIVPLFVVFYTPVLLAAGCGLTAD